MKRAIRAIAKALGVRTEYFVCAAFPGGTMNTTVLVKPWLHKGNLDELNDVLADEIKHERLGVKPHVTSICKIGP